MKLILAHNQEHVTALIMSGATAHNDCEQKLRKGFLTAENRQTYITLINQLQALMQTINTSDWVNQ